jgi:hypothetical protein
VETAVIVIDAIINIIVVEMTTKEIGVHLPW